ncbi:hypothetical protein CPC735_060350 [Coccidioides posadasii C735 delta SOWgp]|uniref:Tat pathway signal sequence n=1 Tax=Coccidioides posadasii (strain C735) TaxID=222929 RepID=C5PF85_COCP7|nr:hypothetical protein CPC735_060350 [Coccidioides posadasii C735 delta SOWgp]EER24665.1 hypothetical protein CPC735_060350 [Coccidioides posadasii C735 delta SOWgp]|eukprot:XP_003066810.1 hypothetical protein CPC735_060350 [Coccidioides posadasii C735 delta SOWgp]
MEYFSRNFSIDTEAVNEAFIPPEEHDEDSGGIIRDEQGKCQRNPWNKHSQSRKKYLMCSAFIVLLLCLVLLGVVVRLSMLAFRSSGCEKTSCTNVSGLPDAVYSPAQAVKEFQAVRFDGRVDTRNIYKGAPSSGLDDAWRELYDGMSAFNIEPFLVTAQELKRIQKTSVEDKIRQHVHNDHYQLTDEGKSISVVDHVDHCIDIVRQALMCQADTTLITFNDDGALSPVKPDFEATHACQNFDKVHDWAREREFNMTEEAIRNPKPFRDDLIDAINRELGERRSG